MGILGLLLLAIAPGAALIGLIKYLDRHEKEPWGLIFGVMGLGALSVIPAVLVEMGFGELSPIFNKEENTGLYHAFLISFVQVAPIEEICKLAPLLLFALRRPEFNEENDGIVYGAASALGFAVLENIFYVLDHGFFVGIARALTSIPMHAFTGVLMGYYIGKAKFTEGKSVAAATMSSLAIAIFLHGAYDTVIFAGGEIVFLMLPMVIGMIIWGIILLKKGQALSLARWGHQSEAAETAAIKPTSAATAQPAITTTNQQASVWRVAISRFLFVICGLLWLVLLVAYFDDSGEEPLNLTDLVVGGTIFTFIPLLIAILLEVSHYKRKKAVSAG